MDCFPLLNTVLLVYSGLFLMNSLNFLKKGRFNLSFLNLILTIFLGILFVFVQFFEYSDSTFSFNDSCYGSVFFLLTGFHGFHVIVGLIFLIICAFRLYFTVKVNTVYSYRKFIGKRSFIFYVFLKLLLLGFFKNRKSYNSYLVNILIFKLLEKSNFYKSLINFLKFNSLFLYVFGDYKKLYFSFNSNFKESNNVYYLFKKFTDSTISLDFIKSYLNLGSLNKYKITSLTFLINEKRVELLNDLLISGCLRSFFVREWVFLIRSNNFEKLGKDYNNFLKLLDFNYNFKFRSKGFYN